ncbi:MAG: RNA-directed DNA polymerase [Ignavibacteriae bacterium]|nr:RNA-directed DNA polymerase [Ignavibacteriota bacterium]
MSVKRQKKDWHGLPKTKSLFHTEKDKGLPIGNLTSQLFGNVYLDQLDHFVKEELGIKYYGRYVDDFILIHKDKEYLLNCGLKIKEFLKQELMLNLHPKKFYLQHYKKGVQFLGVYIKPYRIYSGKRLKNNFYNKTYKWNSIIEINKGKLTQEEKELFRANISSYLGLLQHYNTYNLRKKIIDVILDNYFLDHFNFPNSFEKIILLK